MEGKTKILVEKKATLTGHTDCVYALELTNTPNGLISAAGDGLVAYWDLDKPENGELIAKIPASVYALNFVIAKNLLLVGQNFEGIHVIDWATRKETKSIKITSSAIFDIKTHDNITYVALGNGELVALDLDTLRTIKSIKASEKSARRIALNLSANELAVGYSDYCIRIFDLGTLQLKQVIEAHQNSVFALSYSPDFQYLLSGSRDAHLKIWDAKNNYEPVQSIVAHMYAINDICYHPAGHLFATCSMDKSIKVWDAKQFRLLKVIDKTRHAGHGTSVNKIVWSSYQDYIISGSDDRTISIWNLTL